MDITKDTVSANNSMLIALGHDGPSQELNSSAFRSFSPINPTQQDMMAKSTIESAYDDVKQAQKEMQMLKK